MNIKLGKHLQQQPITSADDLYPIMQRILMRESRTDRNREHFWTVSLNTAGILLNIELVSMGSVRQTLVEPMEVFSVPLQKRAVQLVLVHNHPGGSLQPSAADKNITDQLIQIGRLLHVPVLDHLIITEQSYYSFAFHGLLAELEQSTRYVPAYELKARYESEGKAAGEKQGAAIKAKEMARAMKAAGEPLDKIAQYTGLSRRAIAQLKTPQGDT